MHSGMRAMASQDKDGSMNRLGRVVRQVTGTRISWGCASVIGLVCTVALALVGLEFDPNRRGRWSVASVARVSRVRLHVHVGADEAKRDICG
jgi:hypothetical protein